MLKILVAACFLAIIVSLGSALFFMMRGSGDDKKRGDRMARALAFRIGLSVLLFICILVAWKLGYIHPTGIPLSK
jgi:cytochrome bd-type quinol oxidase subunit 2